MTNQKMSLGEKVGLGVAVVSMVGVAYGGIFSAINLGKSYPTLIEERSVLSFLNESNKTNTLERNVESSWKKIYIKDLEEIRASPQYAVEKQKSEEDKKSRDRAGTLSLISAALFLVSFFYSDKKKRTQEQYQIVSGGQ